MTMCVSEACWELSINAVNQNLHNPDYGQAGTSQRGHANVCLLCGCSIAKRQSDKILRDNPTDFEQNMICIIKRRAEPRQVTSTDRVCHVCWLRIKREVLRNNDIDENRLSHHEEARGNQPFDDIEPIENTASQDPSSFQNQPPEVRLDVSPPHIIQDEDVAKMLYKDTQKLWYYLTIGELPILAIIVFLWI